MFLIHLHFTHQHVLGKHPATSEFYELCLRGCFSWTGISYILPQKKGTRAWEMRASVLNLEWTGEVWMDPKLSTDVIHSPGIASCIYSQNISPLLTWNFLSTLRDGQGMCICLQSLNLISCHLEESPSYSLQAKANLGSSKSGWNLEPSTACCFLRKQHFALPLMLSSWKDSKEF